VTALAQGRLIHQDSLVRRLPVDCCTPVAGSSLGGVEAVELERLLRALADRHRLRILNMLVRAGGTPICVCEFTAEFELVGAGYSVRNGEPASSECWCLGARVCGSRAVIAARARSRRFGTRVSKEAARSGLRRELVFVDQPAE
jgi:DNA-binding transcriptional ArsR family regulator